jgi:hypothetical protein
VKNASQKDSKENLSVLTLGVASLFNALLFVGIATRIIYFPWGFFLILFGITIPYVFVGIGLAMMRVLEGKAPCDENEPDGPDNRVSIIQGIIMLAMHTLVFGCWSTRFDIRVLQYVYINLSISLTALIFTVFYMHACLSRVNPKILGALVWFIGSAIGFFLFEPVWKVLI